jgi:hypothetical protein
VSTSGIASARRKLERGNVHLAALRAAIEDFRENSPYEFTMESPGNERWKPGIPVTVTVTQAPSIPDDWALITGDILTNVRAALDHAVFPHICPLEAALARARCADRGCRGRSEQRIQPGRTRRQAKVLRSPFAG